MSAVVVGVLASFWVFLHLMYKHGALAVHGYIVGIGREVLSDDWNGGSSTLLILTGQVQNQ